MAQKRVAVVTVHGVADQRPFDTAEQGSEVLTRVPSSAAGSLSGNPSTGIRKFVLPIV